MPKPTIPRTPIPKFKRKDLDVADLCAQALWYGIDYQTGNFQTSDADLMSRFAPYFYEYHKTKKRPKPDIFVRDVKELILSCKMNRLFMDQASMSFRKGIDAIYKDVYPIFLAAQKSPTSTSSCAEAVNCLEKLSKGLVLKATGNRLNLASRILFFLSPNLQTFNMNNSIAISYGLQTRPYDHYAEYFELLAQGLITNQTALSKYKIPSARDGLDYQTWFEISRTNWWKRRVLDIAVLLRATPAITPNPNLRTLIKEAIKLDKTNSAII